MTHEILTVSFSNLYLSIAQVLFYSYTQLHSYIQSYRFTAVQPAKPQTSDVSQWDVLGLLGCTLWWQLRKEGDVWCIIQQSARLHKRIMIWIYSKLRNTSCLSGLLNDALSCHISRVQRLPWFSGQWLKLWSYFNLTVVCSDFFSHSRRTASYDLLICNCRLWLLFHLWINFSVCSLAFQQL